MVTVLADTGTKQEKTKEGQKVNAEAFYLEKVLKLQGA